MQNLELKSKKKFSVSSLFAGAGGLDIGLDNSGFQTIWANDFDKDSTVTYKSWSDAQVIHEDISKLDFNKVPKTDLIVGGFPCQGFSLAGPRKIDDSRNKLYHHFVQLVSEKRPMAFIAENVKGILTLGNGQILQAILSDFEMKGYDVFFQLLNASDYEVPQDRFRVFFVGFKKELDVKKFDFPEKSSKRVTIKDALHDMSDVDLGDVSMQPFSSRYTSRNRRRDWNEVSFTIPAMAKQVPLHPSSPEMIKLSQDLWEFGKGATRRFSWKEASAIQTFPTELNFYGDLVSKYKQIGNAVPVKLAEKVGVQIYKTLINL